MIFIDVSIFIFILLESMNVIILYFAPNFKMGNGVAVFKAWHTAKDDKASELFAKYMAHWVAGSKLIFITLLVVILAIGSGTLKVASVIVIIISILTYYFGLHPIINKLDIMGQIIPKGYSKVLLSMITGFIAMFSASLALYFISM